MIEVPIFEGDYNIQHSVGVTLVIRPEKNPLAIGQVTVAINGQKEQQAACHFNGPDKKEIVTDPIDGKFEPVDAGGKKNTIQVWIQNTSDEEQKVVIRAYWPPNKTLYVLAVGVSKYPEARGGVSELPNASRDAEALAAAFENQEGGLFYRVVPKLLIDSAATNTAITDELEILKQKATFYDQVVVTLSGHGAVYHNRNWYFTPYNFNPQRPLGSAVFWTPGLDTLTDFKCDVLLLVDTCHAGAVTREVVENCAGSRPTHSLVIFAACLGNQKVPDGFSGHGALSLAVLEAMKGEHIHPRPDEQYRYGLPPYGGNKADKITLFDLRTYVVGRVEQVVGSDQSVVVIPSDSALQRIAIARNPKSKSAP